MSKSEFLRNARQKLGRFFKVRREEMGRSSAELAEFLGISENTLRGIESGRFAWDIDMQLRLCAALDIKPYYHATSETPNEDFRTRSIDDPQRYHGFYMSDNVLLFPEELAIIKLTYPRLFLRFNYREAYFSSFEEWKLNITVQEWLDPDDKPGSEDEIDSILVDCWNFLALTEREDERLMDDDDE